MKFNFMLSGMTSSTREESAQIDLVVMPMDESVSVELSNVRTVKHMPISGTVLQRRRASLWYWVTTVRCWWCHVAGRAQREAEFVLTSEYRVGQDGEPVAVRHSLGWAMIGPVGGGSYTADCSANLLRVVENSLDCASGFDVQNRPSRDGSRTDIAFPEGTDNKQQGHSCKNCSWKNVCRVRVCL